MVILSKLSNFEMEEEILELYWHYMSDLPPTLILEALETSIVETGSKSMFPSARKLRSLVDPVLSTEDQADQITRVITKNIAKHGYTWQMADKNWPEEAKKELGELGWEIVQRVGSWETVCEECRVKEPTHFHAQMKKTAISTIRSLEKETLQQKRIALSDGRPSGDNLPPHVPRLGEPGQS